MKPKTWKNIQQRLEENMRYMDDDGLDSSEYQLMLGENECMGWLCQAEGKGKAFEKYEERVAIQIQAEGDGID